MTFQSVNGSPEMQTTHIEDSPLGLLIGQWELDLTIDAAGSDQSRIERLDAVRRHQHLRGTRLLIDW